MQVYLKRGVRVECSCGSTDVVMVEQASDVDIYRCNECNEWFESDTFVPHGKRYDRPRKQRMYDDD